MTASVDLQPPSRTPNGGFPIREETSVRERPRPSPVQSGRLDYIDTLRGAAAVQVLLSHAMLAFFPGVALASPLSGALLGYLAATPLFFAFDGASAVCIFFVLSGYVLTPLFASSRATGAALIFSRFARLGAPAVAGCALSAVLFQFFTGYNQAAAVLAKSQWLAEGWRPSPDLWFLKDALVNGIVVGFRNASIVQWFGFPASALPSTSSSYVAPLWTLSVEFYGSIFVLILARSRSWLLLVAAALILSRTYLLCFLVGHLAARLRLGVNRPAIHWFWATAFAILGVLLCMASHFWSPSPVLRFCALPTQILPPCPAADPNYLMRIYGATVFTVAVMQCAPARSFLGRKGLRRLGRLSFPLYLTHWPIIFGVGSFLLVASAPWIGPKAARCLALIASVVVTGFASAYFERVDQFALRLSRALRDRKVAAAGPG
jgi:peptidoglycan/LPS O-acetylase OafA/YrhL